MQKCAPSFEYIRHVHAQGFGAYEDHGEEQQDLNNSRARHIVSSKFLWTQKRVHEINKQQYRCDSGNDVVHKPLLSNSPQNGARGLRTWMP
jgi:hypothetical protein